MSTTSDERKAVAKNGQISPVAEVPESQLWTLQEPHRSAIERGMAWAAENPRAETDLDKLLALQKRHPERKQTHGSSD